MERLKALSAILLAAILIFSMMSPLPVCAQSYQPTIDAAVDLNQTGSEQVIHSAYVTYGNLPADTHQTVESAVAALRSGMKSRQSEIAINLLMDGNFDSSLSQEIFDSALTHTGNPTEGDYLRWQYAGCGWSGSYIKENGVEWIQSTYYPAYYTTAAQEAELDMAVKALLDELDLWDASDYDKISGVYGWICQNVTYDYENLEEESYLLKFTAYAALMDRTAVCQGYSTLLYRLLLELGIDNRVISGTGNGGAHAWNIVKLDGLYYNVDVTWDASYAQAGLDYSYFLLPDADFEDHIRDEMYATAAFYQEYPMHEMEYTPGYHEHRYEATVTAPTCTEAGYTTYTCACGHSYVTDRVKAQGHVPGEAVKENAEGSYYEEVVYCEVCGTELSRIAVSASALGDLNGDGEVDIKDANLVCSYYNELIDLSDAALAVADVNGDGEIDIKDANLICSYYNEVIDSFPAEQ